MQKMPPHCTMPSTYEGVCLHFNESRGNGLFNLASELEWILWLRIWQCHLHTLRKWWFYTCWLSPCVKWLFHHCQRQMLRSPLLPYWAVAEEPCQQQTTMTRGEGVHWCELFCKEYQSSYVCLYRRYCIILNNKCPPDIWLNLVSQKCLRQERDPFTTRSPAGNLTLTAIHQLFQGRCTAASH